MFMNNGDNNSQTVMTDREMINDLLNSQKMETNHYNTFATECANVNLKNDFVKIWKEEQEIQTDLFNEMQVRGWYQVKSANPNDINQAKQKYQYAMQ